VIDLDEVARAFFAKVQEPQLERMRYNQELMNFIGELAGLLTSIAWSGTSVLFTKATQQVGSIIVNRMRVILALLFLILLNWAFYGYVLPFHAGVDRWIWFALSGVIGYALGDLLLFQSFVCIGAQRGMLMMSLAPLMSAGLAWVFFGEILTGMQLLGVMLTLAGVTWVILRRPSDANLQPGSTFEGVLFGLGAAIGQAVGYVLSKQGLTDGFPPLAGNSIRMLAAVIVLWALASIQGKAGETLNSMRERPQVLGWLTLAAFGGPVLGATLSLFALQHTQVGIASTLIALPPVFLLPVSWLVFKEKFDWGAVLGTLVTIGGVALLFLA
jgi:drug/metabolite transporter (DMT)-like permease